VKLWEGDIKCYFAHYDIIEVHKDDTGF